MSLSQSSTCTQVSNLAVHAELARPQSPKAHPVKLPEVCRAFQGPTLRSAAQAPRSMAAPKAAKALKELVVTAQKDESRIEDPSTESQLASQVSEDFAVGEFRSLVDGEAVRSLAEDVDGGGAMRVRKPASKSATRTSRRRALVMCLALGMVRPCTENGNLRRTTSTNLRRSASSSFTVSGNLQSQVSIASSLKAASLLEDVDAGKL